MVHKIKHLPKPLKTVKEDQLRIR